MAEAARLLVQFLDGSPLHLGALALLQEIRAGEGKPAASEALLRRIVRLAPNDLPV
jgi:hypothetical protein